MVCHHCQCYQRLNFGGRKVVVSPYIEKIFDAKREYLFTTRKNIRNFEWTTEEAEDLFEDILDIDEMANIGGSLELGSITIIKKGTTAKIGENSCLYDVHDGQQRLVSLSLLLAANPRYNF